MEAQEDLDKTSHETKNMSAEQVLERMSDMRKTLLTLEWDKKQNQIHFGMEEKYNKLKEEYKALEKQLSALKDLEKEEKKEKLEKEEKIEKVEKDVSEPQPQSE